MIKLPFNNPKSAVIGIVAVIALFAAYKCSATEIEAGATYTGEFNGGTALLITQRFAGNFDVGLTLVSEQEWEAVKTENNGNVFFAYNALRPEHWWKIAPSEVSIGAGAWFKKDGVSPITNCHGTYTLGLKWRFGPHASLGIRHFSNAGICSKNRGQDMLNFGWRF